MPELLTQRDIITDPAVMEAAIVMNRQIECGHGMCAVRAAEAVTWLALGRIGDASRAAELVDERCNFGRLESARHSLLLHAA